MALFQKKQQVQNDEHMSDEDNKAQLAALDQKLSQLNKVAAK
jgi:phosphonate transport system substrate-binding protein